jgi:hypothetical protein
VSEPPIDGCAVAALLDFATLISIEMIATATMLDECLCI